MTEAISSKTYIGIQDGGLFATNKPQQVSMREIHNFVVNNGFVGVDPELLTRIKLEDGKVTIYQKEAAPSAQRSNESKIWRAFRWVFGLKSDEDLAQEVRMRAFGKFAAGDAVIRTEHTRLQGAFIALKRSVVFPSWMDYLKAYFTESGAEELRKKECAIGKMLNLLKIQGKDSEAAKIAKRQLAFENRSFIQEARKYLKISIEEPVKEEKKSVEEMLTAFFTDKDLKGRLSSLDPSNSENREELLAIRKDPESLAQIEGFLEAYQALSTQRAGGMPMKEQKAALSQKAARSAWEYTAFLEKKEDQKSAALSETAEKKKLVEEFSSKNKLLLDNAYFLCNPLHPFTTGENRSYKEFISFIPVMLGDIAYREGLSARNLFEDFFIAQFQEAVLHLNKKQLATKDIDLICRWIKAGMKKEAESLQAEGNLCLVVDTFFKDPIVREALIKLELPTPKSDV